MSQTSSGSGELVIQAVLECAPQGKVSQPLSARFGRIEIDYDVESWCQWAIEHDIVPEIIAYHRWADSRDQQMLFRMPETGDESQFPTGRGWEGVSDLCKVAPAMAFQHAVAKCGMAAAVDFKGFLEVYRELPMLQDIVDDPRSARVPVEPGQLYAVSGMLGKQADASNLKPIVAYLKRLPVEFSVMAITDAIRRVPEIKQVPGFTDWAASSQAVTL